MKSHKIKIKLTKVFMVRLEASRTCYVEADMPERAAEIAESGTRFGDLRPDGSTIQVLGLKQAVAAYDRGCVMKG